MDIGNKIPRIKLKNQSGESQNLLSEMGENGLIIFFYPKDNTYGCTREACAFRDHYGDLQKNGYGVIGISHDDTKSHQKFATAHNLPFTLLSDSDNKARKAFGLKKSLFGLLAARVTFLVNHEGIVIHKFNSQIQFKKHLTEMVKMIRMANKTKGT